LVETETASILIDCGVSPRLLSRAVASGRKPFGELDAVLISHEHGDHVRAVDRVLKSKLPILATAGTLRAIKHTPDRFGVALYGVRTELPGGIVVTPIETSHDANEPCGFGIETEEKTIVIVTDTGTIPEDAGSWIARADLVVLESNHDLEMLKRGPYPLQLKRRVLSKLGHLSNFDCGIALKSNLVDMKPRTIWLAHLSETNNLPDIAVREAEQALAASPVGHEIVALERFAFHVWNGSPTPGSIKSRQLSLFGL
jgi:phosphoribosyl 1,2-cyclic phosphodiesterase